MATTGGAWDGRLVKDLKVGEQPAVYGAVGSLGNGGRGRKCQDRLGGEQQSVSPSPVLWPLWGELPEPAAHGEALAAGSP